MLQLKSWLLSGKKQMIMEADAVEMERDPRSYGISQSITGRSMGQKSHETKIDQFGLLRYELIGERLGACRLVPSRDENEVLHVVLGRS